jgi:hypothetical protein
MRRIVDRFLQDRQGRTGPRSFTRLDDGVPLVIAACAHPRDVYQVPRFEYGNGPLHLFDSSATFVVNGDKQRKRIGTGGRIVAHGHFNPARQILGFIVPIERKKPIPMLQRMITARARQGSLDQNAKTMMRAIIHAHSISTNYL